MKLSTFCYILTGASFLLAIGSAIFINPILIISSVCSVMIFINTQRIKNREGNKDE